MNIIYTSLKPEKNGSSNPRNAHTKSRLLTCKSLVNFIISLKNTLQISRLEKISLFCNSPPTDSIQVSYNYGLVCVAKRLWTVHQEVRKIQAPHQKKKQVSKQEKERNIMNLNNKVN